MHDTEIFDFLNKYSTAAIATTDGIKAYLRHVWTVRADNSGILFHTGKMKDFYRQLIAQPWAEFCFVNEDKSIQVRVSGKVRLLEDENLKLDLLKKRPFLQDIQKQTGNLDFLAVFIMEECRALIWNMESNLRPKQYIDLHHQA